jgi:peptide/nickel transport system ATP-binding protein
MSSTNPILRVDGLEKHYPVNSGAVSSITNKLAGGEPDVVHAVDGISFTLDEGEALGIAGESGCGKTTTGMSLVKLLEHSGGTIEYRGTELSDMSKGELREFRQNVQMIFQDPFESLNPRMTVYDIVSEPLRVNNIGNVRERTRRAINFAELQPAEQYFDQYPSELSGGERQRIAIARSIVIDPDFIVADEPVSMLDVSLRAGVLSLLERMTEKFGLSIVYISHDISLLAQMVDRLAIMYMGKIVEVGPIDEIIDNPRHPYTKALIDAVPVPDPSLDRDRVELQGEVGDAVEVPSGCRFKDRCPEYIGEVCDTESPALESKSDINGEQQVACHLYEDPEDA